MGVGCWQARCCATPSGLYPSLHTQEGAAIDVGSRMVSGIVGDVGSCSDGIGSDVTLEGGHVFASDDAVGRVTAARSVADGRIDIDDPAAAARSDDAASSMQEKGKDNKNGSEDIGIQA
jgi:hypothetical protein